MTGSYYCALRNEVSSKMHLSEGLVLSVMEPVADARITPGEDELAVTVEDNLCLTCSVAKGKSSAVMGSAITLAFLLLLFVTALVAFKYRSKMSSFFLNHCFFQRSSGGPVTKAQYRAGPRQQVNNRQISTDVTPSAEQPVYGNASSSPAQKIDDGSVTYAAVKCKSSRTSKNHGEHDASIYENFNAK